MKRLSILAVFMLISVITFAQQALWGSQNIISPEIHPDNTVTFRFMAPKAIKAQVTGEKEVIECRCGLRLKSFDDWCSHDKTLSMNGDDNHYSYRVYYEDTPAQGHYETQVIQAAYDEQVWVQD